MDDGTIELISIDVIERIIKDNDTYQAFMRRVAEFEDIDEAAYVRAINDYMSYATIHSNDMTATDFNRVNCINLSNDIDITYDYDEYLSRTFSCISVAMLNQIISDEATFNKFMNFDMNRELFGNVDITNYLDELNGLIEYYYEHDIELSSIQNNRIRAIKRKYSLRLKRTVSLEGYTVTDEIDPELFKRVIDKIDITREPFYVARAVYIELAKLVSYDPSFLALNQDVSIEQANDIYNKKVKDITLDDNRLVCKDWAELYCSILNLLGIRAVVSGDFHKYVTFDCDGTLMKADATNTVNTLDDSLSMPDLTRIQIGLQTGGYVCLEKDKDITDILHEVDKELGFATSSIEKKYNELEERYLKIKAQEKNYDQRVFDSIDFLRRVSCDSSLDNFELFKYITAFSKPLFNKNKVYGVETKFICVKGADIEYDAASLLAYSSSNGNIRYIIFTKGALEEVSESELIDRINNGQIKVLGKNTKIMGIDKESFNNGITK